MASKLQSAAMVVGSGTPVVIANGRKNNVLGRVFDGADVGTFVQPASGDRGAALSHRERWISFFHKPKGALVVDDGAREAILQKGRSLLPIGVREVEGAFEQGDVVNIRGLDGKVIAHGLTEYGSNEARMIKGRRTAEIASLLGSKDYDEIIHRDNMVFTGK
jgi:glutamate 5-kinase